MHNRLYGDNRGSNTLITSGLNIGVDGVYNGNDDQLATVSGIRPDEFGQIFVDLTLIDGSFAYLNAMRVTAVPEPTALVVMTLMAAGGLIRQPPYPATVSERSKII